MATFKIEFYSGGPDNRSITAESYYISDSFMTFVDEEGVNVASYPAKVIVGVVRED